MRTRRLLLAGLLFPLVALAACRTQPIVDRAPVLEPVGGSDRLRVEYYQISEG